LLSKWRPKGRHFFSTACADWVADGARLERAAFAWNRHREERSAVAIEWRV
jgi:hypothetical protein